ncbi:WhiB family transcriptional regulator [Kitasatospora indigofera]|uniref:WhiB family transcriptional regulator n=1 Tax=Kitasatospora indigofera TaxID=67307 RepID=UPI0036A32B85
MASASGSPVEPAPTDDPRLAPLSPREREVLAAVGRGLNNTEIARQLHLTESTVKKHVGQVLAKTGARDRVQGVITAYECGIVVPYRRSRRPAPDRAATQTLRKGCKSKHAALAHDHESIPGTAVRRGCAQERRETAMREEKDETDAPRDLARPPGVRHATWREQAACRSEDPELFFPIGTEGPGVLQAQLAKAVCARCLVIAACAEAAMTAGETYGVWGGMDEKERRDLSRTRNPRSPHDRRGLAPADLRAAERDVRTAASRLSGVESWLETAGPLSGPMVAEVWVFDTVGSAVLLVEHPWRGLVPPGGKVEPGETPRRAAARELFEETGVSAALLHKPAMASVRRFREDSPTTTLCLTYAALASKATRLRCEPGQPARWFDIDKPWPTHHPDDRQRMIRYLASILDRR